MRVGRAGRRVAAKLGLESEPGTRKGETPTSGAHLLVAERRGHELDREKESRSPGLGRVGRKKKRRG